MSKTIAIIEDNNEIRENLCEILELSGYTTFEASNGIEGIKVIRNNTPDLILCDVMMPELDGFGVLRILNNDPSLMNIPFMFLTAKSEKEDFRKGMRLGADDYITKPYDDVELLDTIEMRLKKAERISNITSGENEVRTFFDLAKGEEELQKLSLDREVRNYRKKDTIYSVGQYPNWLYYIVEGQVKVVQTNDFGKDLITNVYGEGDFFGFVQLLKNQQYSSSAITTSDCKIRLIPKEDFHILLYNDRDFAAKFINLLAGHTMEVEKQLLDLAYSSVRKRVATALLTLSEKSLDGRITVMRDEIAALAGTAKETTIRTLSDFKNEGMIEISSGAIVVLDAEGLGEMPQ